MICKDAINRNYLHAILDNLKITLLVVPSYSTGHYDFEANLKVCEAFDCNVVWTNACSAVKPKDRKADDTLGFVLRTGKMTGIPNGMYCMRRENCMKLSGGSCRECMYIQKMYFRGMGCK